MRSGIAVCTCRVLLHQASFPWPPSDAIFSAMQVLKNTFTCGGRSFPIEDEAPALAVVEISDDHEAKETRAPAEQPTAAAADGRVVQRAQGAYNVVGQRPTRLSRVLGRCVVRYVDEGEIDCASLPSLLQALTIPTPALELQGIPVKLPLYTFHLQGEATKAVRLDPSDGIWQCSS